MMDNVRSKYYIFGRFMSETGKMPKERDTGVGVLLIYVLKRDDNELDAEMIMNSLCLHKYKSVHS